MNDRSASDKSKKCNLGERGSIFLACRLNFPAGHRATRYRLVRKVVRIPRWSVVRRDLPNPGVSAKAALRVTRTATHSTRRDPLAASKIRRRDLPTLLPRRRRRRCCRSVGSRRACVTVVLRTHARTGRHAHVLRGLRAHGNQITVRYNAQCVDGRRHRRPGQCDARRNASHDGQSLHAVNSRARA